MDKPSVRVSVTWARNVSIAILVGVVLGAAVGIGLLVHKMNYTPRERMFAGYFGELLFQMFHCVAMPLIFSSVTCAVAYIHSPNISILLCIQFIVVGIVCKLLTVLATLPWTLLIRPGTGLRISTEDHNTIFINQNLFEGFLDVVRNIFPMSIMRMTMMHEFVNVTKDKYNQPDLRSISQSGCNWLGLVMIAALIGLALHTIDPRMESPLFTFCTILTKITTIILHGIIRVAPVLVISTVAGQMVVASSTQHLIEAGKYFAVMFVALFIQMFIFYPILIAVVGNRCPFKEYRSFWMPFLVAGATGSSLTVLPLCTFTDDYDPEIVQTMFPLSLILNKDGSCIFFTAATITSILYNGRELTIGNICAACVMAVPLSMACPGIPQGGMLMLPMALLGHSMQYHDMIVVLVLDWLVDRCVTVVNVAGSIVMLAILNRWDVAFIDKILHEEQIDLQKLREEEAALQQEAEDEDVNKT